MIHISTQNNVLTNHLNMHFLAIDAVFKSQKYTKKGYS